MTPAYPLLCFNAAVCLYLMRGWIEVAYIKLTNSPYRVSSSIFFTFQHRLIYLYQASRASIFSNFTFSLVVATSLISVSRILALWNYYHSPLTVAFDFQFNELPRLLNVSGLLPVVPAGTPKEEMPRIDLTPVKEFNLTLCLGKDWYRFPGHYLVPNGIKVEFIKSEFDGMLPRHFEEQVPEGVSSLAKKWWFRPQTAYVPTDLNDLNKEEPSHYVRLPCFRSFTIFTDSISS